MKVPTTAGKFHRHTAQIKIGKSLISLALLALLSAIGGCGKPSGSSAASGQGTIGVDGKVQVASQCPNTGTVTEFVEFSLSLQDCPADISELELLEPPAPIMVQADCNEKLLTIRNPMQSDGFETTWYVMPNGEFNVAFDGEKGGMLKIKNDGAGNRSCTAFSRMEFWGHVDCTNLEQPTIILNAAWYLGAGKPINEWEGKTCSFPSKCYMHTRIPVKQCR